MARITVSFNTFELNFIRQMIRFVRKEPIGHIDSAHWREQRAAHFPPMAKKTPFGHFEETLKRMEYRLWFLLQSHPNIRLGAIQPVCRAHTKPSRKAHQWEKETQKLIERLPESVSTQPEADLYFAGERTFQSLSKTAKKRVSNILYTYKLPYHEIFPLSEREKILPHALEEETFKLQAIAPVALQSGGLEPSASDKEIMDLNKGTEKTISNLLSQEEMYPETLKAPEKKRLEKYRAIKEKMLNKNKSLDT